MARIFVSYSRLDRRPAKRLIDKLAQDKDAVWYDQDLSGGVDWWRVILQEIRHCKVFIFLLSNHSVRSEYCLAELREAMRLHKKILPVKIDRVIAYPDTIDPEIRSVLDDRQHQPIARRIKNTDVFRLLNTITALIEQITDYTPPPRTPDPTPRPRMLDNRLRNWNVPTLVVIGVLLPLAIVGLITAVSAVFGDTSGEPAAPSGVVAGNDTPIAPAETQAYLDYQATLNAVPTVTLTPSITPSPSMTPTITPTPTATLNPIPGALERARGFTGRNTDWVPFVWAFDGVEMVLVPAGCFLMGTQNGDADERPVHQVCFDQPFWIDRTEVTSAQFGSEGDFSGGDRPRENATWDEARAYCASRGARLPTEAEWEYAARGPDDVVYPWGNTFLCSAGNFDDETAYDPDTVGMRCDWFNETAPVGRFPQGASWVGALDMAGNVWEWVADWYSKTYYDTLAEGAVNPPGPREGSERVLRGGSWTDGREFMLRAANRGSSVPYARDGEIGFRCARDVE